MPAQTPPPIRIVLTETTHPGNIGAAARAMKVMELSELYLVNPKNFPSVEATARASSAADLLADAVVVDSLPEALTDCVAVYGASARLRSNRWPILTAREAAPEMIRESAHGPVACVFGPEQSGLSNKDLGYCQSLVHIPVNPEYGSLNLAASVQIIAYELHSVTDPEIPTSRLKPGEGPATSAEVEQMFQHLEATLTRIGFLNPQNPGHLMARLRRLFNRARLSAVETRILRGILSAVDKRCG